MKVPGPLNWFSFKLSFWNRIKLFFGYRIKVAFDPPIVGYAISVGEVVREINGPRVTYDSDE